MNDVVSRAFDTLIALLIASILGTILLGASAFAMDGSDSAFYFNESGQLSQRDYWSPSNRSRSDYETDKRMYQDHSNRETLRSNDETIQGYYNAPRSSQPAYTNPNPMFGVHGPDGKMQLCQRSFDRVYCH